jgi:serine/threonine protein kinase
LLFDSKQQITEEEKINFVRGIARGMFHLHNHNIIHRDLAARNILLSSLREPKISVRICFFQFFVYFVIFEKFSVCHFLN